MTVRPLAAGDHAAWGRLWQGYLTFYETSRPPEMFELHFARLIDPAVEAWQGLVAETADGLAGLAHLVFHPHGWYADPVCYMQDLYVDPGARGQRIGQALIEASYAVADARGAPRVYWTTQEHNHTARRLYDRIGRKTAFIRYERG